MTLGEGEERRGVVAPGDRFRAKELPVTTNNSKTSNLKSAEFVNKKTTKKQSVGASILICPILMHEKEEFQAAKPKRPQAVACDNCEV